LGVSMLFPQFLFKYMKEGKAKMVPQWQ